MKKLLLLGLALSGAGAFLLYCIGKAVTIDYDWGMPGEAERKLYSVPDPRGWR